MKLPTPLCRHEPIHLTRDFAMKHALHLVALALAGAALAPAQAAEAYASWDNFTGAVELNPARWQSVDRILRVEGGALRFLQRDLGSQSNNTGSFNASWGTNLKNPHLITQMRAAVTVNNFGVTACTANPNGSVVQTRLVGTFFNAGPGLATSRTNDVGATLRLVRNSTSTDAPGLLRVQGTVFQCTTPECNGGEIGIGSVDLGTATIGETVVLKMEWEQAFKRFNFYRGTNPVMRVTYTADDSQVPFLALRAIGNRTSMANCLAGNRTDGFIDAKFDNVNVNASAAP